MCALQGSMISVELNSFLRLLSPLVGVFWPPSSVARMPTSPHLCFFSPVSNKHPFVDSNLLYQFRMNFRRRRRLMELLNEKSPGSQETHDSPFCLRKQSHDNRKSTSFMSVSPSKEIKIVSAVRRSSMSSCGSSGYFSSSPTLSSSPPVLCNPKSVLKRPVTSEELLTPGAPYARKTFTIVGDAVGWGFVVRGSKPCHIQAVDPSGPAAAAGMKTPPILQASGGRQSGEASWTCRHLYSHCLAERGSLQALVPYLFLERHYLY
uniref:DEP domain containing MTOR interacting protein n=1 Tax=Sus scrofa TaxID=9823 RepID=A0A8D1ASJ1_PIG